jgi:type IV secretion system protein PtlE
VYGQGGFVRVHIESVSVLAHGLGQVRFSREDHRDGGREKVSRWIATIGFVWHPDALISNADRTINPLGFQVSDYHIDAVIP